MKGSAKKFRCVRLDSWFLLLPAPATPVAVRTVQRDIHALCRPAPALSQIQSGSYLALMPLAAVLRISETTQHLPPSERTSTMRPYLALALIGSLTFSACSGAEARPRIPRRAATRVSLKVKRRERRHLGREFDRNAAEELRVVRRCRLAFVGRRGATAQSARFRPNASGSCNGGIEFFSPDRSGNADSTESRWFYDAACTQLARDQVRLFTPAGGGARTWPSRRNSMPGKRNADRRSTDATSSRARRSTRTASRSRPTDSIARRADAQHLGFQDDRLRRRARHAAAIRSERAVLQRFGRLQRDRILQP